LLDPSKEFDDMRHFAAYAGASSAPSCLSVVGRSPVSTHPA
jgi:hypothetical protein